MHAGLVIRTTATSFRHPVASAGKPGTCCTMQQLLLLCLSPTVTDAMLYAQGMCNGEASCQQSKLVDSHRSRASGAMTACSMLRRCSSAALQVTLRRHEWFVRKVQSDSGNSGEYTLL